MVASRAGFLDIFVDRKSVATNEIVRRVEEVAKARQTTMAIVATAWCLGKTGVVPIVGLINMQRVDEMVKAVKIRLTDTEIQFLEKPYIPLPVTGSA